MVNANDFSAPSDHDRIEAAIAHRGADGIVLLPPRCCETEPTRRDWLLDRAILLPENTTLILQNCIVRLSDRCRDNFFRSANCGIGISDPAPVQNIHIRGEGCCQLIGAAHPRASGDSGKTLQCPCPCQEDVWVPDSYGTDAGKPEESPCGDWRNIGILLANVSGFSISGLSIVEMHAWGISLEACSNGRIEKIHFDAQNGKEIDGVRCEIKNQDGVDLRNGCHHIVISDITGNTGDDVIALTAIADQTPHAGGSLRTMHVMHNDWSRRESGIHNVIIRNVIAQSARHQTVRLLPCNTRISNVIIDGVIDTAPAAQRHGAAILLGDADGAYGVNLPDGLTDICVSNVISSGSCGVRVAGFLKDAVISGVVQRNPDAPLLLVTRDRGLENVRVSDLVAASGILCQPEGLI